MHFIYGNDQRAFSVVSNRLQTWCQSHSRECITRQCEDNETGSSAVWVSTQRTNNSNNDNGKPPLKRNSCLNVRQAAINKMNFEWMKNEWRQRQCDSGTSSLAEASTAKRKKGWWMASSKKYGMTGRWKRQRNRERRTTIPLSARPARAHAVNEHSAAMVSFSIYARCRPILVNNRRAMPCVVRADCHPQQNEHDYLYVLSASWTVPWTRSAVHSNRFDRT